MASGFSLAARFPKASKDVLSLNQHLTASPIAKATPVMAADNRSPLAVKFEVLWENIGGPEYIREHPVCSDRKWRLDYFWPCGVFLELQGGIYLGIKGGHTGARQFKNDCDKWNKCASQNWVGFKLASGQVTPENVVLIRNYVRNKINQHENQIHTLPL